METIKTERSAADGSPRITGSFPCLAVQIWFASSAFWSLPLDPFLHYYVSWPRYGPQAFSTYPKVRADDLITRIDIEYMQKKLIGLFSQVKMLNDQ